MTFSFTIGGRGWFLGWNFTDYTTGRRTYFAWRRSRAHMQIFSRTFEQAEDGGLIYRVVRPGRRMQGWRLRGPIEHIEGTW